MLPLYELYFRFKDYSEVGQEPAECHPHWHAYASSGLPLALMELASNPDIYVPSNPLIDESAPVPEYKVLVRTLPCSSRNLC